jgi:hypothetical protein
MLSEAERVAWVLSTMDAVKQKLTSLPSDPVARRKVAVACAISLRVAADQLDDRGRLSG